MSSLISILLPLLATLIILAVVVQSKGTGLSIAPGTGDFGKFERRGAELILHRITIGLIAIFIGMTLIAYFIG